MGMTRERGQTNNPSARIFPKSDHLLQIERRPHKFHPQLENLFQMLIYFQVESYLGWVVFLELPGFLKINLKVGIFFFLEI